MKETEKKVGRFGCWEDYKDIYPYLPDHLKKEFNETRIQEHLDGLVDALIEEGRLLQQRLEEIGNER